MRILVLAGGFGTRLRSVVCRVPKPMAPVGSVAFLHYQVEHWVRQGARSFVFLLHHQADLIEHFIEDLKYSLLRHCEVELVIEHQPLGTGGAVANAVKKLELEGDFIVANADTWIGSGMCELGNAGSNTIVIVRQENVSRYGLVEMDNTGLVVGFREKGSSSGSGWINAGMAALRAEHFLGWDEQPLSLEKDIFPRLIVEKQLRALPVESDFIDIGIPEDYFRFCRWQESGREGDL